jgi:pullulanase
MQWSLVEMRDKYAAHQYVVPADAGHPATQRRRGRSPAYVFMLSLGLASGVVHAGDGLGPVERGPQCDPALPPQVLHPAATPAVDARAYWLARGLIQWPGAGTDGRFSLYASATAALHVAIGHAVTGADEALTLTPVGAAPTVALAERFGFIADGPRLALPADADVAALLRGQLLLVREDARGRAIEATALQTPGVLDDLYAAAAEVSDLGATVDDTQTRFALWAPTARNVAVCVYPMRDGGRFIAYPMARDDATGVWRFRDGDALRGRRYAYLVEVYVPGAGIVRNRATDPYSVGLSADSVHSVVLDLDHASTKPEGWDAAPRPPALAANVDMSVYELHVRDFSRDDLSVREDWRGKYVAFTVEDSAGMRHLRALGAAGITDIHLLPAYDLSTVPERGCIEPTIPDAAPDSDAQQAAMAATAARDCFNWGYDPYHYSTPEGSYATDPQGAMRVREFRTMVQALHAAGLRVGMDVVYNHTFASGQDPKSVLDRIVPGYYHRLDASGKVERSTCCENTATEHRMMAKLMIDSAVVWAKHYRIDSFRFDLMGHQPRAAMERLQVAVDAAAGRRVPLLGEGWNFGEIANGARFVQASQLSLGGSGIATFSDRARDALRGGGCCDGGEGLVANQGLLNGLHYAPNALNRDVEGRGKDRRAELLRAADLARIGLAGTLREVELQGADGVVRPLSKFDYAGQPAGYAAQPGEVVNYVENHDNMTLFDLNALRMPRETSREDRARVQMLGVAFTAFSQGVAYYHAGIEILRSKSLDKNSFDSGDAFNRLDWSYTDNGFGRGLPPAKDNGKDWPWMRPVLADAGIKPRPDDIAWMRDAFIDLSRIRAGSTLFRLRSADDVRRRLSFRNTGPDQNPMVIVAHLDGAGHPGAGFREILYFINVAPDAQTLTLPEERGKPYALHPVQRAATAADDRPKAARHDAREGRFTIPARSAVVYVVE